MEKRDIEHLREQVSCAAVLQHDGWKIDVKESTRCAVKYRRGAREIIIVIHDGNGWFDPLSDAKGDVFSLAAYLDGGGFAGALEAVGGLVGFVPTEPAWKRPARVKAGASVASRWRRRPVPRPGSRAWNYLAEIRTIPPAIIETALRHDRLREGPHGSVWACHTAAGDAIVGWEERGPKWRGFATGGAKELFRFGSQDPKRICVTEAAIDALSLAAIESMRPGTLYVSTGGGWSPAADAAIRDFASWPDLLLVAATDSNRQGHVYAERIQAIAQQSGYGFFRLMPRAEDWNEDLRSAGRAAA